MQYVSVFWLFLSKNRYFAQKLYSFKRLFICVLWYLLFINVCIFYILSYTLSYMKYIFVKIFLFQFFLWLFFCSIFFYFYHKKYNTWFTWVPIHSMSHNVVTEWSRAVVKVYVWDAFLGLGVSIGSHAILTSKHMIAGSEWYTVLLSDGSISKVNDIEYSESSDLALLIIERAVDFFVPVIESQDFLQKGDFVIGIWMIDFWYTPLAQLGILSSLDASWWPDPLKQWLLLSDIDIQSGDSGWPLFDIHGNLIGIQSAHTHGRIGSWSTPVDSNIIATNFSFETLTKN